MDGRRSFAEILLSGGIILVVQLWVWVYVAVSGREGRVQESQKINNHDPNRSYVVAYIGSIFFSFNKGNKREGYGLGL